MLTPTTTNSKRIKPFEPPSSPDEFPTLRAISAGLLFFRRVLVYQGPPLPLEFVTFRIPRPRSPLNEESARVHLKVTEWNAQWEAGPYRAFDDDDLPEPLAFLRDLDTDKDPTTDIVLIPDDGNLYHRWGPLYHLLPRRTVESFGLPLIHRGVWPVMGMAWGRDEIRAAQENALARAVAQHLWSHGLGKAKSPLSAFSKDDSLRVLSHDLGFWRSHFEILMRKYGRERGRVRREDGDTDPESLETPHPDVRYEMPRFGTEVWTGEAEASEVTRDLIELADQRGRLRAVIDAIRSNRVEEDFSKRWSAEREDFERKLYRKRNKVKVSFVELDESIPYFDAETEVEDNMLYRSLMTVVQPKDRHVVVCLHNGITRAREIADRLGYSNHSPVSKALKRIRRKAAKLLD